MYLEVPSQNPFHINILSCNTEFGLKHVVLYIEIELKIGLLIGEGSVVRGREVEGVVESSGGVFH
jgi:hypothetical protein